MQGAAAEEGDMATMNGKVDRVSPSSQTRQRISTVDGRWRDERTARQDERWRADDDARAEGKGEGVETVVHGGCQRPGRHATHRRARAPSPPSSCTRPPPPPSPSHPPILAFPSSLCAIPPLSSASYPPRRLSRYPASSIQRGQGLIWKTRYRDTHARAHMHCTLAKAT